MLIGEVAERSGVPARTIRFYEQRRILGIPSRSSGGYRVYSERTLAELAFIKRAQQLGFSLEEIREVLSLGRGGRTACSRVSTLCESHLRRIARQMVELQTFRRQLLQALRKAKAGCGSTREGFCEAIMGS